MARITEPERVISSVFLGLTREGNIQVNRGYRVHPNSARSLQRWFVSTQLLTMDLEILGFEQIFKNVLTGLPIGGGKGGSDFDPKGKT